MVRKRRRDTIRLPAGPFEFGARLSGRAILKSFADAEQGAASARIARGFCGARTQRLACEEVNPSLCAARRARCCAGCARVAAVFAVRFKTVLRKPTACHCALSDISRTIATTR